MCSRPSWWNTACSGLITAAISGAIGTLTAWAVLVHVMDWEWTFLPSAVLTTAVICTAITLAFGFVGTWRALGPAGRAPAAKRLKPMLKIFRD